MYRVSPFTYLVSGMLSVGIANSHVICATKEYLHFNPPAGDTCASYMESYISYAGGYILNKNATSDCQFCSVSDTNVFLASVNSYYSERWRNFGLMFVFIIINIFGAIGMYWLVRVPKKAKKEKVEKVE
jgi:ATP-binding cassette, subfamily G (WHITE), member 2, PDR